MEMEAFQSIVGRLYLEFECRQFILSGGEPFLHPLLGRFVTRIRGYGDCNISIVTNGTLWNDAFWEANMESDNLTIQVSLDGSCEAVNERTRGPGNFDRAVHFLERLKTLSQPPVVHMVLTKLNAMDVGAFYRRMFSAGYKLSFDFARQLGKAAMAWDELELSPVEQMRVMKEIDRLNNELDGEAEMPISHTKCPLGEEFAVYHVLINSKGVMYPCQISTGSSLALGNIFNDSVCFIRDEAAVVRNKVQQRTKMEYGCRRCFLRDHCGRGCPAVAEMRSGDLFAEDGLCDVRRQKLIGIDIGSMLYKGREDAIRFDLQN